MGHMTDESANLRALTYLEQAKEHISSAISFLSQVEENNQCDPIVQYEVGRQIGLLVGAESVVKVAWQDQKRRTLTP